MGKRVLLVDDASFMRIKMKQVLDQLGHEVVGEAANGEEAITQYIQLKPDVVTMDITMPVMDGIQALQAIKGFEPQSTVIMCSAMGQEGMVVEAIKNGALDFIVKPFKADRLLQTVNSALGK